MPFGTKDFLNEGSKWRDDMRTMTLLLTLAIFVFIPVAAFSASCAVVSRVEKGQYVQMHVSGAYQGHISGKVIEVSPKDCIIVITTTTDYRTYYVDAERIAAIGVKPQR